MFDITITRTAEKEMRRIPDAIEREFFGLFRTVATAPFANHAKVKKLRGVKDAFRIRVRDWRAIYFLDRKARRLIVLNVRKRGEAYR